MAEGGRSLPSPSARGVAHNDQGAVGRGLYAFLANKKGVWPDGIPPAVDARRPYSGNQNYYYLADTMEPGSARRTTARPRASGPR